MNDYDEFHELLNRAAADAPERTDRAGAAMGRARRVRRNRRIAIATAATAALAGVAALVIPILPSHTEGGQRIVIEPATPTPTPSPTDDSPAPTEAPTPTPSPIPSASPIVIDSGPVVVAPTPTPTPTPTPSESLSYSVSTRLGSGASNGYPLTVIAIHVTGYLRGDIIGSPYLFIDPNETIGFIAGASEGCSRDPSWRAFDRTFTFSYAFREATTYPVHLNFFTGVCGDYGGGDSQNFRTTVDVPAGSAYGNGPVQPYFNTPFGRAQISNGQITVNPSLLDDDGNITQFAVDWGNGDAPSVYDVQQTCHDPSPSGKYWPYSAMTRSATSPTLAPGTYTVTITETSVGCDGKDPQTASTSHTFTVPAA